MQSSNRNNLFSLRNLFLYIVVVILPVFVAYFALESMIEEQFGASRELLKQELELQSANLVHIAKPEYQLKDFFNSLVFNKKLLRKKPETISATIEKIDKLYPDTFKWIFWDSQGNIIPIKSRVILHGQKQWEMIIKNMLARILTQTFPDVVLDDEKYKKQLAFALSTLQKAMGSSTKIEHLYYARNNPTSFKWFNQACTAIWESDTVSYSRENYPEKIRFGCLLFAFPEKFPEDFWVKRMISNASKKKEGLKFPLTAVNLTFAREIATDKSLPPNNFIKPLIEAYVSRTQNVFSYGNYLVKAILPEEDSQVRIFSMADLSKAMRSRDQMLIALRIACFFLILLSSFMAIKLFRSGFKGFSLRRRIAAIFLIAILMPILSLLSIGKSFVAHEETRMTESAYVKMRSGVEALELRYKDAPRLLEQPLFNDLKSLVASASTSAEFGKALDKAQEQEMLQYYLLSDDKGKIVVTNWEKIDPGIKKTLELAAGRLLENENRILNAGQSVLKGAMDEEMQELLEGMQINLDFSRPSHLRHYVYIDQHMYFLSITVVIHGKPCILFAYLPDYFLERGFANREFSMNLMATEQNNTSNHTSRPELSFFSTFKSQPHIPAESDLWQILEPNFNRASSLKVEDSGKVVIDGEEFLFLIKPLTSMFKQSYVPCLISSKNPINQRLREVSAVVAVLAFIAILGTMLLSLILAASLLGPISQIDQAAQEVGKGNLSIALPDMGTDEIGRLSQTFNNMVKGLREREKMQAYVSDSVLEAVQDHSDTSVHDGKSLEVTILFSDIRNFTGISEQNSPKHVFALLNEYFGGVEPIIRENNGRVDKFIGDAVMAVFHHTSPEHHSLSAIKAAFAMKRFLKKLNIKRTQAKQFTIDIGVGISTGSVLLGDVGSERRKDLTVIGDEVNLASRLETASKKGRHSKIIISGNTYNLVKDQVIAEEMPFTEIRGKQQAVQIYELVKLKIEN